MGMTMTQKILSKHAGKELCAPGDLIEADLDLLLGNDITTPPAIDIFEKNSFGKVFDTDKIVMVPDHFAPNKDIKSAEQCKRMRDFAKSQNIKYYYEQGEEGMGVEHVILPDNGLVLPGFAVIGADSHTCTYGALGAFSTGVGSTDLACAMAAGSTWFRVPEAIRVDLKGKLNPYVSGKDVILYLIGLIGVDGALYRSLEFTGEGVAELSMADRLTICNMAIECGAKNGIFPVDEKTIEYLDSRVEGGYKEAPDWLFADPDAIYEQTITIDLSEVPPMVSFPHLPSNTHAVGTFDKIKIDQVVIGSCTNGRLEDMKKAAAVLKGRHVAEGIRAIILPGSQRVYKQCLTEGLLEIFVDAGCVVSAPTCGPCLGGHMGVLAKGEKCVSTTNRNFVGRMGHKESEVYLAGVEVAAASAVKGYIASPAELE
ncbi:MAG: 3-isopropylmalate dehydratase large subunit [Clostridiales bacterium]|nr:3-isopropylmalate dehydratase large subunit [Clostridiales bacterium]